MQDTLKEDVSDTLNNSFETLFGTEEDVYANIPAAYHENQATARKANAVIAASYRLSMNEQRVLFAVLQQVPNNEEVTDQQLYYVKAADIVPDDNSAGNEFRALRSACNALFNRVVVIRKKPNGNGLYSDVLRTRWIQSEVTYFDGHGMIGLRLSHDILPYVNQLKSDFSRIPTQPIMAMRSTHAVRIFEMMMQFRTTGFFKISVSDLRERLGLEDSYPRFSDFKKRVINVALKQINEAAELNSKVDFIKRGRAVEMLVFQFERDNLKALQRVQKQLDEEKEIQAKADAQAERDRQRKEQEKEQHGEIREAMLLLVENGYDDASLNRVQQLMNIYKKGPIDSVLRKIKLDTHKRDNQH